MTSGSYPLHIIGSGKAAVLHLEAYLRLWEVEALPQINIALGSFVQPQIRILSEKYPKKIHMTTLRELMRRKEIDSIVDICTPTATHRAVLEVLIDCGYSRFLVEKPLVTNAEDFTQIHSFSVRLALMQNYLFSRATQRVLDLIQSGEIRPFSMISVFSKDRRRDSIALRGFHGDEPPHVFTIELPHQLYLATAFLGPAHVVAACSSDMVIEKKPLLHHGAGMIQLEHGDAGMYTSRNPSSLHFSCLTSETPVRRVLLICDDGKSLTVDFPTSRNNLTSRIEMKDGIDFVYRQIFKDDDMIKMALKHHYIDLSQGADDSHPCQSYSERSTGLVIEALHSEATLHLAGVS